MSFFQKQIVLGWVVLLLSSCEELIPRRARQMYDAYDQAVEEANNGDSTILIVLIIATVAAGIIWIIMKNKN